MGVEYRDIFRREGTMAQVDANKHARLGFYATNARDGVEDTGSFGYYDASSVRHWLYALDDDLNPQTAIGENGIYFRHSSGAGTGDQDLILVDLTGDGVRTTWPKLYWNNANTLTVWKGTFGLEGSASTNRVRLSINSFDQVIFNVEGVLSTAQYNFDKQIQSTDSGKEQLYLKDSSTYEVKHRITSGGYYEISGDAGGSDPKLGLWKTSPSYSFDMIGDMRITVTSASDNAQLSIFNQGSGDAKLLIGTGDASWEMYVDNAASEKLKFRTLVGCSYLDVLTITRDEKVGINKISPTSEFHVYRNTSSTIMPVYIEEDGSGDSGITFMRTGLRSYSMGIDATDNHFKLTRTINLSGNGRIRIDDADDASFSMTIGANLDPSGGARLNIETITATDLALRLWNDATHFVDHIIGSTGNARISVVSGCSAGRLAIGDFDADYFLDVGGEIRIQGAIRFDQITGDPDEPTNNSAVVWESDGSGKGDVGDIMIASRNAGLTMWGTLFDYDAANSW